MYFRGPNLDDDDDEDAQNGGGDAADAVPSTSSGRTGGRHRKPKTPQQRAGEKLMKHILDAVEGEHYAIK